MLAVVQQTLAITAPVFAMLFLGVVLKRLALIDGHFINTASALVFNVSMPVLLFLAILHADLDTALQPVLLGYFLLATVLGFLLVASRK
jgi:predicted permease